MSRTGVGLWHRDHAVARNVRIAGPIPLKAGNGVAALVDRRRGSRARLGPDASAPAAISHRVVAPCSIACSRPALPLGMQGPRWVLDNSELGRV